MAPMCSANRGDAPGMARCREPVVDRRADLPALNRRLTRTMVSGNQQNDPVSPGNRILEATIDRTPCLVEIHAVQIEDSVRVYGARGKPTIPASVERRPRPGPRRRSLRSRPRRRHRYARPRWLARLFFRRLSWLPFARERLDRRRHPRPQRGLFRAERPHGRRHPWAAGSAPAPNQTCPPRSRLLQGPRPRTCRTGLVP